MVHVLRQLHSALKPDGVLLDVHPLPAHTRVEVWRDGDRAVIGHLDDSIDMTDIRAARGRLRSVVREGLFEPRGRRWFDYHMHFDTLEAWMQRREERDSSSVIPPDVMAALESRMRLPDASVVLVERARATVFARDPTTEI